MNLSPPASRANCHPERYSAKDLAGTSKPDASRSTVQHDAVTALGWVIAAMLVCSNCFAGTKVTINDDKVLLINGKKVFPIGFTMAPAAGAKRPAAAMVCRSFMTPADCSSGPGRT